MLIFVALLWWVAATDQAMSGSSEALATAPVATTESLSELPEGTSLPQGATTLSPAGEASPWQSFVASVRAHVASDIGMLLIQLVVILLVVRVVGWLFARLHQPTVIGEILAGILLGPSLLGAVWPELGQSRVAQSVRTDPLYVYHRYGAAYERSQGSGAASFHHQSVGDHLSLYPGHRPHLWALQSP